MTEIVLRPGEAVTLRMEAGVQGASNVPVCGTLTDRGIEITRAIEPVRRAQVVRQAAPKIGARVSETRALITDPATGKYPHPCQFVDEMVRALELAVDRWGDIPWADVQQSHWTMLLRFRLDRLLADNRRGVRATEITISRLITAVRWLREMKLIPRDAADWPSNWKAEIVRHWKGITKSARDPEAFRPRYTLEESHAILRKADFDPRFELLLWLGMELRLGQVARARRADLALDVEADSNGRLTVYGAGKKGGTVVELTAGQRAAVDRALGDGGYLYALEQLHQASGADYLLFPAGYVSGRVARTRGDTDAVIALSPKANFDKPVSGSWIRKNFNVCEERAGIPHIKGRCAYGLRRLSVDVGGESDLSPAALQALGGWTDIKIPETVYRSRENRHGRREARGVRAKLRGEVDRSAGTPKSDERPLSPLVAPSDNVSTDVEQRYVSDASEGVAP